MAGRKALPTTIKKKKGTLQKCRMVNEPEPDPYIPRPPGHLDEIALEEWGRISAELYDLGLLSKIDRAALAAYCVTFERWVRAEAKIKKGDYKYLLATAKGNVIQNPLVGVANRAMELMHKFLTEFGMTPSSRSRVDVKKPKENNPFKALSDAS